MQDLQGRGGAGQVRSDQRAIRSWRAKDRGLRIQSGKHDGGPIGISPYDMTSTYQSSALVCAGSSLSMEALLSCLRYTVTHATALPCTTLNLINSVGYTNC